MSKYNNVKPDHFKTKGREPQGRDIIHHVEKQEFGTTEKVLRKEPIPPKGTRKAKPAGSGK